MSKPERVAKELTCLDAVVRTAWKGWWPKKVYVNHAEILFKFLWSEDVAKVWHLKRFEWPIAVSSWLVLLMLSYPNSKLFFVMCLDTGFRTYVERNIPYAAEHLSLPGFDAFIPYRIFEPHQVCHQQQVCVRWTNAVYEQVRWLVYLRCFTVNTLILKNGVLQATEYAGDITLSFIAHIFTFKIDSNGINGSYFNWAKLCLSHFQSISRGKYVPRISYRENNPLRTSKFDAMTAFWIRISLSTTYRT